VVLPVALVFAAGPSGLNRPKRTRVAALARLIE
jgi:hypothetical protein